MFESKHLWYMMYMIKQERIRVFRKLSADQSVG